MGEAGSLCAPGDTRASRSCLSGHLTLGSGGPCPPTEPPQPAPKGLPATSEGPSAPPSAPCPGWSQSGVWPFPGGRGNRGSRVETRGRCGVRVTAAGDVHTGLMTLPAPQAAGGTLGLAKAWQQRPRASSDEQGGFFCFSFENR